MENPILINLRINAFVIVNNASYFCINKLNMLENFYVENNYVLLDGVKTKTGKRTFIDD